ncbi:hypothetical protein BD324DRAFT_626661 [Kockovaella imperatae]|uniref:Uncharacterized protein n=1 Tax=Kockovaella imperatae TaxID=4999 RepID=A0A1Y1UGJ4_9TREE|nr:hypothetical protein BD324DRAFT_626661 [Kockovaella imperatae]ORX36647.1 hypothetical protein BD324DRAFT_626661 [Kockovaella imperatae]
MTQSHITRLYEVQLNVQRREASRFQKLGKESRDIGDGRYLRMEPDFWSHTFTTSSFADEELQQALLGLCDAGTSFDYTSAMANLECLLCSRHHWILSPRDTVASRTTTLFEAVFRIYLSKHDGLEPVSNLTDEVVCELALPELLIMFIYGSPPSMPPMLLNVVDAIFKDSDFHHHSALHHALRLLRGFLMSRMRMEDTCPAPVFAQWQLRQVALFRLNGNRLSLNTIDVHAQLADITYPRPAFWRRCLLKGILGTEDPPLPVRDLATAVMIGNREEEFINVSSLSRPPLGLGSGELDYPFDISDSWHATLWGFVYVSFRSFWG